MCLAVLFGAGASKGAGNVVPAPPPLGGELYAALRFAYPGSWDQICDDLDSSFRRDFETAMDALWSCDYHPLRAKWLVDMGAYFAQFEPATDGEEDLYTHFLKTLVVVGMLPRTAFATLNYECILDVAASRLELGVDYFGDAPTNGCVLIWKPHGACNLVPSMGLQIVNSELSGRALYEGGVEPIKLAEMLQRHAEGNSLPPAMSLYAPGKPSPVAPTLVATTRDQWRAWVGSSDVCIIIGARPNFADSHI